MRCVALLMAGLLAIVCAVGCDKKEDSASPTASGAKTPAAPSGDAAAAANAAMGDAQAKLDQVTTYIKENKLDLADKTLTQLESHKAEFSAALQDKIAQARKALDAAKAGGVKVPSLPGQ